MAEYCRISRRGIDTYRDYISQVAAFSLCWVEISYMLSPDPAYKVKFEASFTGFPTRLVSIRKPLVFEPHTLGQSPQ